jgi:polar amino acid transport system substrate-binding protein
MLSSSRQARGRARSTPAYLVCSGILVVLSLIFAACGSNSGSTSTGSSGSTASSKSSVAAPKDLITQGVLTIGSDTTYPPQEYIDTATNKATGFDVDLITAMAARMGLRANVVTAKFDSIIDSLTAKRFDVVISAVTITPERKQRVDFVPYFNAGESLLVQKGNPKNIKSLADLCGQSAGVQNGTVEQPDLQKASDDCRKAGKPAINIEVLQDQTAVIQLLATNRVIATYQDSPVTDYYNKLNSGRFEVAGSVVNAAPEGIVVRKGDTSMFNAVQQAFNAVKADGTYQQLINKWGLSSGAISAIDSRKNVV